MHICFWSIAGGGREAYSLAKDEFGELLNCKQTSPWTKFRLSKMKRCELCDDRRRCCTIKLSWSGAQRDKDIWCWSISLSLSESLREILVHKDSSVFCVVTVTTCFSTAIYNNHYYIMLYSLMCSCGSSMYILVRMIKYWIRHLNHYNDGLQKRYCTPTWMTQEKDPDAFLSLFLCCIKSFALFIYLFSSSPRVVGR